MAVNIDNSRKKQIEGVWTTFEGSKFKVANSSNNKFQRQLTRLQAPYRRKIENGTLDPKVGREILCQAMAEGILIDWADVVDGSGNNVEFTPEIAAKALENNDDLREYLQDFARDYANFRNEETEEAGKS